MSPDNREKSNLANRCLFDTVSLTFQMFPLLRKLRNNRSNRSVSPRYFLRVCIFKFHAFWLREILDLIRFNCSWKIVDLVWVTRKAEDEFLFFFFFHYKKNFVPSLIFDFEFFRKFIRVEILKRIYISSMFSSYPLWMTMESFSLCVN